MANVIDTVLAKKTLEDLIPSVEKVETPDPELTVETVNAIMAGILNGEGYGDIASSIGFDKCTKAQVLKVATKMKARIAELQKPLDPEIKEGVVKEEVVAEQPIIK